MNLNAMEVLFQLGHTRGTAHGNDAKAKLAKLRPPCLTCLFESFRVFNGLNGSVTPGSRLLGTHLHDLLPEESAPTTLKHWKRRQGRPTFTRFKAGST